MSVNNKRGPYRKKRGYSPRDDQHAKDKQKSLKLKQSHLDAFGVFRDASGVSFNGFVGNLIEDFAKKDVVEQFITSIADLKRLTTDDVMALIGNGVDAAEAFGCLKAWLDGLPMPALAISPEASIAYKAILERLKGTYGETYTEYISGRQLEHLRQIYFFQKGIHLALWDMTNELLDRSEDENWNAHVIRKLDERAELEYMPLNWLCAYSAQIRFAIYDCWYKQKLQERAPQPDWAAEHKDRLEAMNRPLGEKATPEGPEE